MKAFFLGAALVAFVAFLAWHQFRPKPPSAPGPGPLDLLSVTDPQLYRPENLRRFKLNDTEYCAPRIQSLQVFIPKTTDIPLGAAVMLNPDTLTNFNQHPYRDGKPNPDWRDSVSIGISPVGKGWEYGTLVERAIGKSLEEVTDADLSSLGDIAKDVALARDNFRTDRRTRLALVKLDGLVVRLEWSPAGIINVLYPISDQAKGRLTVNINYVERIDSLFEIARNFFRPCDSVHPAPN